MKVPAEIVRQPFQEAKPGLTAGPIAPRGRHFGYAVAREESLHGQLQIELEPSLALHFERFHHVAIIDLERVRCIMRGQAAQET